MAKVLVTDDTSFIGKELVNQLLKDGASVIGVSDRATPVIELRNDDLDYRHIMLDPAQLTSADVHEDIDILIDLAWRGSRGDDRMNKPLQNQNIESAISHVELASELGADRYMGVGTITELAALAAEKAKGPATAYGLSKNLAHLETKKRANDLGIEHVWARLANVYSEYDTSGRFFETTLRNLLAEKPIELKTGKQPYDFIHASDAARALSLIAMIGEANSVYYVGNGDVATLEDHVSFAREIVKSNSLILSVDSLPVLTRNDLKNDELVDLGYKRTVDFQRGVELWLEANISL